jgi:hypothetical protein
MLLVGSLLISAASAAGMIAFSASPVLGELAALTFVLSAFVDVCARQFLKACVSGCALARSFLVSAPPVSASWKPFPGAECRDRFANVGDRFANI